MQRVGFGSKAIEGKQKAPPPPKKKKKTDPTQRKGSGAAYLVEGLVSHQSGELVISHG